MPLQKEALRIDREHLRLQLGGNPPKSPEGLMALTRQGSRESRKRAARNLADMLRRDRNFLLRTIHHVESVFDVSIKRRPRGIGRDSASPNAPVGSPGYLKWKNRLARDRNSRKAATPAKKAPAKKTPVVDLRDKAPVAAPAKAAHFLIEDDKMIRLQAIYSQEGLVLFVKK